MKFSRNWIQSFFDEALPDTKTLVDKVTLNAFEVEEVEEIGGDTIFDIKILPHRAHDCLGHRGLARDIGALFAISYKDPYTYWQQEGDKGVTSPIVKRADEKACTRFMSVRIDGITVKESPEWLREKLEAIGQKSINNIVDITNFVQFAINKPMHAYDSAHVHGGVLEARFATPEESLTTLDGKTLSLDDKTLVIADSERPLGLAGIKGGMDSGVSDTTSSVILESANFNPTLIRKTATKFGIKTDASKRFENGISDALVEEGLRMTIALILEQNPHARVSEVVDSYATKSWDYTVAVSVKEINALLGTSYTKQDIEDVFSRLQCSYEVSSLRKKIEMRMKEVEHATYKNPSSMRNDAPEYFSCSSLVSYLYNGVWQPSISVDKYVYGEKLSQADATWGDLVFSNSGDGTIRYESVDFLPGTHVAEGIDHVGIYLGDGTVLHISKKSNSVLVAPLSEAFPQALFARVTDVNEERFFVTIPAERLDIRIKEDLIEEVARVKGLSSIKGVLPAIGRHGRIHKSLYYETLIKNCFLKQGFSEVYTYTFGDYGDVKIKKALTDKTKLRNSLASGIEEAFLKNLYNAPLLGVEELRLFEIGTIITKEEERRHVSFAIGSTNKKKEYVSLVQEVLRVLETTLGTKIDPRVISEKPYIVEFDLDSLLATLPEQEDIVYLEQEVADRGKSATYRAYSPYPFIVRDIAVWVPESLVWESMREEIHDALDKDKELLAREIELFDSFTKDGRTSYAFRLVLQSSTKTLTDEEANVVSDKVYTYLKEKGFEIR